MTKGLEEELGSYEMRSAPPPYSNPTTVGIGFDPGNYYQEEGTPLVVADPLSTIMNEQNEFNLKQMEDAGCFRRPVMIQILDGSGRPIMTTMLDPGTVAHNEGRRVRTGTVVNFMDSSGRVVMTAVESGTSMTVTSGDRMLGLVDGTVGFWSRNAVPKNLSGLPLCEIQKEGPSTYMFRRADGSEIGRAGLTSAGGFEMQLSTAFDPNTKAMLLVTAHALYVRYHVRTFFGPTGAIGAAKYFCLIFCILSFLVPILILGIVRGLTSL